MRCAVLTLAIVLISNTAWATMPMLTERPSPPSPEACQAWAAKQDEEAREMWGMLPSGTASDAVGVMRLALHCLGDSKPEIVGVGSSAGYDDAFCRKHGAMPLCRARRR